MHEPRTFTVDDHPRGVSLHGELIIARVCTPSLDEVSMSRNFRLIALAEPSATYAAAPAARSDTTDEVKGSLRVAQASDLAENMHENLAPFLRKLLVDAPSQLELEPQIRALARRYSRVGRGDIDIVTRALREELNAALDERTPAQAGSDDVSLASS